MGSSSSVSRPPSQPPTRTSFAPSTSRSSGFKEIQFQQPRGAQSAGRSPAPNAPQQRSHSISKNKKRHQIDNRMDNNNDFSDLSVVAGQLQREQTRFAFSESDQPHYNKDDMVLETFYHQNGSTYSCLYQGGERLYLDSFESQEWHPFPKAWYSEGVLVTDRFIKDEDFLPESLPGSPSRQQSSPQGRAAKYEQTDDRAGFIDHPTRGRLQTYVFEEKHNVHYYFDRNIGGWVQLPISWELHSDMVKRLMTPIQEALPDWKDQHDMLAALRASNYDPQECVTNYLTIGDHECLRTPRNSVDAKLLQDKENKLKYQQEMIDQLKHQLDKAHRRIEQEVSDRKTAEKQLKELQEEVSSLEVAAATATARLEAMQLERPKTARPPSARPRTPAKTPEPENEIDPETLNALSGTARELHKAQIKLKMQMKQKLEELEQLMKQLKVGVMKIRLFDNSQSAELEELKELYRRETVQRKLLYNKLLELRGNIRVFCRCRYDNRTSCCLQFPNDHEVLPPGVKKSLKFDKVFTPQSTQEEVFEEARPIIMSCVDGYSVCILAYGQTGSGKTFTMQGPADNPGVNVRAIKELLQICQEKDNIDYTLKASMVEIYNECIQDLLSSDTKTLDIRAKGNKITLPGMTEMEVESLKDIEKIIKLGEKNRSTAATKMNSQSSRSHLIFMITVEGHDNTSGSMSSGTLTLCDLAGSERVAKTEAQGQRLVEAAAINKSLSSLGQVFTALRTGQLHIPYRNSKLTHILQPSLGGDAKACLFAMVSPDESNLAETLSTLQFGSNARQVALGQAKQHVKRAPQGTFDVE